MKFTNPTLMQSVRDELITNDNLYQQDGTPYTDPLFGRFFRQLIDWTDEIVPRFSCEGHFVYAIANEDGTLTKATLVDGKPVEEEAFAHFISDPYISFLCTEKGFTLIRQWFRVLVKDAIAQGMNPTVFQLTESVFYGHDIGDEDDETGRITLRILPYFDPDFFDYHTEAVALLQSTLKNILQTSH